MPRGEADSLGVIKGCDLPLGGCIRATGVSHNKVNHRCVSSGLWINGQNDIPLKRPGKNTRPGENVLTKHFMCVGMDNSIIKSVLYNIYIDTMKQRKHAILRRGLLFRFTTLEVNGIWTTYKN